MDSDEYFSFFMLCIAYQRIEFLKTFKLFKPKEIKFTFKDLEVLYAFGYRDGKSKELLSEDYQNGASDADAATFNKLEIFAKMTRLHKSNDLKKTSNSIKMETSREILKRFSKRIQKSPESFFPKVRYYRFPLQSKL